MSVATKISEKYLQAEKALNDKGHQVVRLVKANSFGKRKVTGLQVYGRNFHDMQAIREILFFMNPALVLNPNFQTITIIL